MARCIPRRRDPRVPRWRSLDRAPPGDVAFISRITRDDLARQLAALAVRRKAAGDGPGALPLYGVPFGVKDNIDVEGLPTTAACPEFAYAPARSAAVVERLAEAGAIVIGKTNLDQFATGLVGTRSPYGAVPNSFDPTYVSGGSSSGSASVVARGLVPFALGTDTAGSGRVPAGLNNIVGLKPTRGAVSGTGVVPACRTLDCVSVMSLTVGDARAVYAVAAGDDPADAYSRRAPADAAGRRMPAHPRFGIPARPEFHGDHRSEAAWQAALGAIDALGATCVPIDFAVLDQVAALLYEGPWVAERYAAIEDIATRRPGAMEPVVREIILRARGFSAADTFKAMYRLAALKRQADSLIAGVDALLVPTAPRHLRTADVAGRSDPSEQPARHLHELREPAGLECARGAGWLPERRTAVRDHLHRAGVGRSGALRAGRALAAALRVAARGDGPAARCRSGVAGGSPGSGGSPRPATCGSRWWARISPECR